MTFLLPATSPSFLWVGKNRSYNGWDTAIFANGDLDLHFQDQMIKLLLPATIQSFWLKLCYNWSKDSWDISKIVKRYHYYDIDLWCQGRPSNFYLIAHYISQIHAERMKKIGGVVSEISDVFSFFHKPIFHLEKKETKLCTNPYRLAQFLFSSSTPIIIWNNLWKCWVISEICNTFCCPLYLEKVENGATFLETKDVKWSWRCRILIPWKFLVTCYLRFDVCFDGGFF